jgi:hypothetical protein
VFDLPAAVHRPKQQARIPNVGELLLLKMKTSCECLPFTMVDEAAMKATTLGKKSFMMTLGSP